MNAWVVYHIGSGQAFFSGIALIQLAGIIAFVRGGRWLAYGRLVLAFAGAILVAVSSTPLPAWFYGIAGAVTLSWIAMEGFVKTTHPWLGLGLRCAMLAVWWLGIALEVPYHVMPTLPRLPDAKVFLIGDSLRLESMGKRKRGPSCFCGRMMLYSPTYHALARHRGRDAAGRARERERAGCAWCSWRSAATMSSARTGPKLSSGA